MSEPDRADKIITIWLWLIGIFALLFALLEGTTVGWTFVEWLIDCYCYIFYGMGM